ncbi:MAG: transcription termination factor Rho [Puniceicoccales bacterium]|jgi:transcription termination factor Rho|nr:transcription termination factor Rho [Puniceicoccales bacterium]
MGLDRGHLNMMVYENGKGLPDGQERYVGILELSECERYGQLIAIGDNGREDVANPYVGMDMLREYHLRRGQKICAIIQRRTNFPNPKVMSVERIDDMIPAERHRRTPFDRLTPVQPRVPITLEYPGCPLSVRIIDMFCPIGKGQRGIIVAPPRSGKTLLLHDISRSIRKISPKIAIIAALIDERPEEVTDFKRSIDAEIYASSNDQNIKNHVRIARLASERARNLTESGCDVVLFLDSITRLARAHNAINSSGRTLTGGVDSRTMEIPKKMFALARDLENGGSLTVIATALVETGSKMDDLIFQELKGTGNLEIVLSRKLAEMRIWPAIDLLTSGTRHEELLTPSQALENINFLRRAFSGMETEKATETLIGRLSQYASNREFLSMIGKSAR